MPSPIRRITTAQFALLAQPAQLTRQITAVHLHHTWRPRRQDFRGLATIEAMRKFHMEQNHWSDIAQHLTIDPQGGLWTGRNWNMAPASASGHNGTAVEGPFMIEMVGDFDQGQDPFDGDQRKAAIDTVAHLMRTFGLKEAALKFHNELTNQKSCPGTGLKRADFLADVQKVLAKKVKPGTGGPFRVEHLLGADVVRPEGGTGDPATAAVPENEAAGAAIEEASREGIRRLQVRARAASPRLIGASVFAASRTNSEWDVLKPHVINLAKGELSESGEFNTTPQAVEAIVDAIRDYAAGTDTPRLMIHAHGGLVKEASALAYAKQMYRWYLDHGVYPVFFVWETDLLEIIGQFVLGRRDIFDFTSDPVIEGIVKVPGTAAWSGMKESARLASALDTGDGAIGGGRLFARKFGALNAALASKIPVHAVGHSAGAIFHAHFIPALLAEGVKEIEHLYLLAPAARTELFRDQLRTLVDAGTIKALSMFTMEEDAEEQDDCFKIYRKSLLYLVSHACEGLKRRPILGLHKSIRKDADLRALFGVKEDGSLTGTGTAKLHFSFAKDRAENPLTRSLAHGGFDNDPKTMSAVLRRIVGLDDSTGIGEADFPFPPLSRTFDFSLPSFSGGFTPMTAAAPSSTPSSPASAAAGQRIKALCIGINTYPERPLAGCVNDARAWGRALGEIGATVDYLFDDAATGDGMKAAIRSLVASGSAGDVLVLQYAGHGGQLPNRVDSEEDGYNEALVPIDYASGSLLVDDELAEILRQLPAGVSLTLFMDCCHSGTNSRFAPVMRARAAAGDRPRFMPLDDDIVDAYFSRRRARALKRAVDVSLPGIVHFAACQDHEFAWESNGEGDFTAAAVPALQNAVRNRTTNEAFAAEVAATVAKKQRQHAQLMQPDQAMQNRRLLSNG